MSEAHANASRPVTHVPAPSSAALQLQPLDEGGTHFPPVHTSPATQSAFEAHEVLHPFWHTYGVQSCGEPDVFAVWSSTHVALGTHAPPEHVKPAAQSASTAHVVLHFVPSELQAKSLHEWVAPATHAPLPSHVSSVSTLALHDDPQLVPAVG